MVYKLGTMSDISKISSADEAVSKVILDNLKILDDNYGANRNIDKDDGGYILYADSGTPVDELLALFDYEQYLPEYVLPIDSNTPYCYSLYLISNDFGVVIFTAIADTSEDVLEEMKEQ